MTNADDRLELSDLLFWAFVLFFLAVAFTYCVGCKSSGSDMPPPRPTPKIIHVDKIVPCVIRVEPLEPYVSPERPPHPGHDADEEERKAWSLALGEAIENDREVYEARDAAWYLKIETHNASEPRCAEPVPTPTP